MEVRSTRIDTDGLVGVLCTPAAPQPAPGVLLLGGSEGGMHERDAHALAAEGFTALALAAVSVAGSGVVTQGIDFRRGALLDILGTPTNPWTLHGRPLPYLPHAVTAELRERVEREDPVPLRLAYPPLPDDPEALTAISIAVEHTAAAVLVICGEDDGMWPSAKYSQVALDRLGGHPRAVRQSILPGVGHPIAGAPGEPFTATTSPGPGVTFELGGTPAANSAARTSAWKETVGFLADHLAVA